MHISNGMNPQQYKHSCDRGTVWNISKEGEKYLDGHITNYKKEGFWEMVDKDMLYLIAPVKFESIVEHIKAQLKEYGVHVNKIWVMQNV